MVSLPALIVFLVLIIIVIYAFITVGNILVDATKEIAETFFTSIELGAVSGTPQSFENVCDLRITVTGKIDQTLPLSELFMRINHGDVRYNWFGCHPATAIPLFSIWDIGIDDEDSEPRKNPLAFLIGDAPNLNMALELKNFPNDQNVIKNHFLNPNLQKTINLPSGSFPTPHPVIQEFIITNIPERHYKLTVDLENVDIVGNGGDPFKTNICKSNFSSC